MVILDRFHTQITGKWHIGRYNEHDGAYGIDTVNTQGYLPGFMHRSPPGSLQFKDFRLTNTVLDMLDDASRLTGPFYLQMWARMTHRPILVPEEHENRYRDVEINETRLSDEVRGKIEICRGRVADPLDSYRTYMVELWGMDQQVGRVLDKLDDLELSDDTVVIFTSDHGAAPVGTAQADEDPGVCRLMGCPGPFRGGKHEATEGGVRVPLMVRWPGHVRQGHVNHHTTFSFVDFLPTILSLAGADESNLPSDLDGIDQSDVWLGSNEPAFRPGTICWHTTSHAWRWVVLWNNIKLVESAAGDRMVFDIDADPEELHNLWQDGTQNWQNLTNALAEYQLYPVPR